MDSAVCMHSPCTCHMHTLVVIHHHRPPFNLSLLLRTFTHPRTSVPTHSDMLAKSTTPCLMATTCAAAAPLETTNAATEAATTHVTSKAWKVAHGAWRVAAPGRPRRAMLGTRRGSGNVRCSMGQQCLFVGMVSAPPVVCSTQELCKGAARPAAKLTTAMPLNGVAAGRRARRVFARSTRMRAHTRSGASSGSGCSRYNVCLLSFYCSH